MKNDEKRRAFAEEIGRLLGVDASQVTVIPLSSLLEELMGANPAPEPSPAAEAALAYFMANARHARKGSFTHTGDILQLTGNLGDLDTLADAAATACTAEPDFARAAPAAVRFFQSGGATDVHCFRQAVLELFRIFEPAALHHCQDCAATWVCRLEQQQANAS